MLGAEVAWRLLLINIMFPKTTGELETYPGWEYRKGGWLSIGLRTKKGGDESIWEVEEGRAECRVVAINQEG